MRIVVTGSSGFIGRHLVAALAERGHQVIGLSRHAWAQSAEAEHRVADLAEAGCLEALAGADLLVHLAGLSIVSESFAQPARYSRVNSLAALHVCEAARRAAARVVLVSTLRVCAPSAAPLPEEAPTQPDSPYGYSKLAAEQWGALYGRLLGLDVIVMRLVSVYGPGQQVTRGTSGVVAIFTRQALAGLPLQVDGGQLRDFTYVDDAVQGLVLAAARPHPAGAGYRLYHIGSGRATALEELAEMVVRLSGSPSPIHVAPAGAPRGYVAEIAHARRELGYAPAIPLEEGVRRYIAWYRDRAGGGP